MARKKTFKSEEIELIRYLYQQKKWSVRKISRLFNVSPYLIRTQLRENNIELREKFGMAVCPICKKRFTKNTPTQIYCKDSCKQKAYQKKPRKYSKKDIERYYLYNQVRWLRKELYDLIKSNPYEALRLRKKMIEEEGEEFTEWAVGKVFKDPFFKKMKDAFDLAKQKGRTHHATIQ